MRLTFILLVLLSFDNYGQQINCLPTGEITIFSNEIQLSSDKYQIRKDRNHNYILFYPEGEKHSFWYKITVDSDCRFAFKISSADSINSSSYSLYKNPDIGNFCKDINNQRIIPCRSGKFFREEKTNQVTYYSAGKNKKEEANFIQPVTATKGEIYFLNIRHKEESECGHYLNLIVSSENVSFRATYRTCLEEEESPVRASQKEVIAELPAVSPKKETGIPKKSASGEEIPTLPTDTIRDETAQTRIEETAVKQIADKNPVIQKKITEIAINPFEKSPLKRQINQVTVSGIVLDSITKTPIQADLKWVDEITGKEIMAHSNSRGEYAIVLDEKVIYKLTCSVVGYREKTTKFIRQNLNSETLKQDFEMTDLKPGESFILKHIYFYAGNYAMKPESQPELDKLYFFLATHEKVKIEIQGHTNGGGKIKRQNNRNSKKKEEGWDFHGNEKKLSKYRAEAIKNYLLKKGIVPERITSVGMGDSKMLFPEPRNQKEKEANRRVEVYIKSSGSDLASVLNAISAK